MPRNITGKDGRVQQKMYELQKKFMGWSSGIDLCQWLHDSIEDGNIHAEQC